MQEVYGAQFWHLDGIESQGAEGEGGAGGVGGGRGGGIGNGSGGGLKQRLPQSAQSVPSEQKLNSAPGPPSSQSPSLE